MMKTDLKIQSLAFLILICSCTEVKRNMQLNEIAREIDYFCFSRIDSTGVVTASANSIYVNDKAIDELQIRVVTTESNEIGEYPEKIAFVCSRYIYERMPSPFSRLYIDVQFGHDVNNVYPTKIVNDTMYYLKSGLGFPLDSVGANGF